MTRAHLSRASTAVVAIAVTLGWVTSASAVEVLPVVATDPSPDASRAPAASPATFALMLPSSDFSSLQVEVSSRADLDPDGSLANAYRVGLGSYLVTSTTTPTTYQGSVFGTFTSVPGTYYWQAAGTGYYPKCPGTEISCSYVSPIYALSVVAPVAPAEAPVATVAPAPAAPVPESLASPASLTRAEARGLIPDFIRERTGRSPIGLRISRCAQRSRAEIRCFTSWSGGPTVWAGDLTVSALAAESVTYRFVGIRARRSCLGVATVDECARRVTFSPRGVRGSVPIAAAPIAVPPSPPPPPAPAPSPAPSNCDPSYPGVCIPPPPPDLDCADVPYVDFAVTGSDPHRFDGDNDGIGCES